MCRWIHVSMIDNKIKSSQIYYSPASCSFITSFPVQGRCAGLLWRQCLIIAIRDSSDKIRSAFSTNRSRLFTSDRAHSLPVISV